MIKIENARMFDYDFLECLQLNILVEYNFTKDYFYKKSLSQVV